MAIHEVHTNLDEDEAGDLMLETYQRWIEFALGLGSIGGKMLKNPSGRYASSITAKTTRVPAYRVQTRTALGRFGPVKTVPAQDRIMAIYIDPSSDGAGEAHIIEHGHPSIDLKRIMLRDHPHGRNIPMRQAPTRPIYSAAMYRGKSVSFKSMFIRKGSQAQTSIGASGSLARVWSSSYTSAYNSTYRFMSPKPGSAKWIIRAMPAFSPAKILRDSLPAALKRRIIVPR